MTRRELLQLSVMAAMASSAPLEAASFRSGSRKKGICMKAKSPGWDRKLRDLRCQWFYTWGGKAPANIPFGTDFVPMIWGYWGKPETIAKVGISAKASGIRELLGFNEPDQKKQANLSVEKALNNWPLLMETGLRLGSPGCVQPDGDWMKSFMNGVRKQRLKVDFVCVHSYGGANADALIARLHKIHKLYGKPIWITEFAVGDWKAKSTAQNRHKPAAVLRFMEAVLPRLEKLDFVERYAWFPAGINNAGTGHQRVA